MKKVLLPLNNNDTILALGAESAGNFCIFHEGITHASEDFGDLLNPENFANYKKTLEQFIKKEKLQPDVILCDLHPLFTTTELAKKLAKKFKSKYIPIQHHTAHIFSAIGDKILENKTWNMEQNIIGVACDGTGYAEDGTVWGGEILKISKFKCQMSNKIPNQKLQIERVGHLEHQTLLGGEKAIKEPARLIISIINNFQNPNFKFPKKSQFSNVKNKKDLAYSLVKQYYSQNEFELLWNQLHQGFNCIQTSSTARVLDSVSLMLGFTKNKRAYKHEPIDNLEKKSTSPYKLNPVIEFDQKEGVFILKTTPLFKYLIANLHKDKKRLAATAQQYIAEGLTEIINNLKAENCNLESIYFAGGMANNKIISSFLQLKGIYVNEKIPRGDGGISFGQTVYYLLTNPRN